MLPLTTFPSCNDWLVARAEQSGFVPGLRGLRLVAANASAVRFYQLVSQVKIVLLPNPIRFALHPLGA